MKWLYRILRLFFCPHVWVEKVTCKVTNVVMNIHKIYFVYQFKYCGEIRKFR